MRTGVAESLAMSTVSEPRLQHLLSPGPGGWQRLAYAEWGAPDNPEVVVCVHGLSRNGRDFDALARALAPRYRVICPDVVGRGLSDWLPDPSGYTYPRYLADAALLIARLGVDRVHWVGTSMGGILGMLMAALPGNPLRSLVLNDVGALIPKAALEVIGAYVGKPPICDSFEHAVDYLHQVHAGFGLSREQWLELGRHSVRPCEDGQWRLCYDPRIGDSLQPPFTDVDLSAVWAMCRLPSLILRGADSRLLSAETLTQMVAVHPATQTATWPGYGHAPGLQAAGQIAVIADFLAAQAQA
jgi:pimeloyl-ACP methyl ester carboxylesterase